MRREITPDDQQFMDRQRRAVRILRTVLIVAVLTIGGLITYLIVRN